MLAGAREVAVGDDAPASVTLGAFLCLLRFFLLQTSFTFLACELGQNKETENPLDVCLVDH